MPANGNLAASISGRRDGDLVRRRTRAHHKLHLCCFQRSAIAVLLSPLLPKTLLVFPPPCVSDRRRIDAFRDRGTSGREEGRAQRRNRPPAGRRLRFLSPARAGTPKAKSCTPRQLSGLRPTNFRGVLEQPSTPARKMQERGINGGLKLRRCRRSTSWPRNHIDVIQFAGWKPFLVLISRHPIDVLKLG